MSGHVGAETIVVVGLASEARLFRGTGARVVIGGGDVVRLAAGLDAAVTPATARILSFGLAGGLRPGLKPGALIVAARVLDAEASHETDEGWRADLLAAMENAIAADFVGVDAPVAGVAGKAELSRASGAAVVDTESHVAARFAREREFRFAAVRAIADPAERALPPAALVAMRPDGGVNIWAVARSVLSRPAQIGALIRLGRDAGAAMRALD